MKAKIRAWLGLDEDTSILRAQMNELINSHAELIEVLKDQNGVLSSMAARPQSNRPEYVIEDWETAQIKALAAFSDKSKEN